MPKAALAVREDGSISPAGIEMRLATYADSGRHRLGECAASSTMALCMTALPKKSLRHQWNQIAVSSV